MEKILTKQVIVIRKDLKMRKGKMISQGAHASMKVFFDLLDENLKLNLPEGEIGEEIKIWMNGLFTKITCGVDSIEELDQLFEEAISNDLPCARIVDAGLTEFDSKATVTAIAIGPASANRIDPITQNLKLL